MNTPRIILQPKLGITAEQAHDTRACAWAFVFQCWHENQKPAEHTPEPDGRNDAAIDRNTEGVSHVEQRPDRPSEITYPAAL